MHPLPAQSYVRDKRTSKFPLGLKIVDSAWGFTFNDSTTGPYTVVQMVARIPFKILPCAGNSHVGISNNQGPYYGPQDSRILVIETPKKGPLIVRNPPCRPTSPEP